MSRLGILGLLLGALLLGGCTDADSAADRRASVGETNATAAPWRPPSALDVPEPESPAPSMGRRGKAQVQAYVGYLLDSIDYALRTTYLPAVLRKDARCRICEGVVATVDRARSQRALYELDDWSGYLLLSRELPTPRLDVRAWRVRLMLWQPEMTVRDETGEVIAMVPASNRETVLDLSHSANEWAITHWSYAAGRPPAVG